MATKTKLPVRRNIEPLFRIASELESHLQRTLTTKNEKIHKKFSGNFNGSLAKNQQNPPIEQIELATKINETDNEDNDDDDVDDINEETQIEEFDRLTKAKSKQLLQEKDEQIEKLVERLTMLHKSNIDFAAENAQLQQRLQKTECTACKLVRQHHDDALKAVEQQFYDETHHLRDDVKMMKSLVYRLNVQLERYQEMLRQANVTDAEIGRINFDAKDLNWGPVNGHTLGPLLHAYTEIIDDKNDLIQQYENDSCHFAGRLKGVVEENDTLQRQMDEMKKFNELWTTEKTRLEAQLNICRNKAEVQTKRADVAKEKLVEVLRCYEQKIQAQNLELERINEAYARTKGELMALRNIQQTPPEMIVESLKECQKLFEELKGQHSTEKIKLSEEMNKLKDHTNEIEQKLKHDRDKYADLKINYQRQKDANIILNNKNTALRQSLARIRLARESLKNRLKINSLHRDRSQRYHFTSKSNIPAHNVWNNDFPLPNEGNQNNGTLNQNMHTKYLDEIEKLSRKLQQRDETLKKVLQAKTK